MFWFNKIKELYKNMNTSNTEKTIEHLDQKSIQLILTNSIMNSDDRIYKYLLDIISTNTQYLQNNTFINNLLYSLAYSSIPPKYILKRIKLLSTKIILYPYFIYMVQVFNNIKIIYELHKYYYIVPHTFKSLQSLNKIILDNYENVDINKILSIFKTNEEKILFNIIIILTNSYNIQIYDFNILILKKIIINNYLDIIDIINWELFMVDTHPLSRFVFNILHENNLLYKYLNIYNVNYINPKIFFFTRFYIIPYNNLKINNNIKTLITINNFLHRLRIISKRRTKSKVINYNIKMYDILKEIKSFSPNKNKIVLKDGSIEYQYQKQKFTNLPARHLLPGEIHQYQNFLIKEKADGSLINNLPIGIFPEHEIINKYQVKAEYIEDLDLYLIFDIDIPNTTLIDRYNILRESHHYTYNTSLQSISNLDEFFEIFNNERKIIKTFLKENQEHSIKWYPKFGCLVNNSQLNDQLIQNIILEGELSKKLNY
jgi:hypothetical protein